MDTEYTKSEIIGDTRHDYGGFPKSILKGAIIDIRGHDHEGSESTQAYVVISNIEDVMNYLTHVKPRSEIPANAGNPSRPKYAQWYKLDINKIVSQGLVEKRQYFEFANQ